MVYWIRQANKSEERGFCGCAWFVRMEYYPLFFFKSWAKIKLLLTEIYFTLASICHYNGSSTYKCLPNLSRKFIGCQVPSFLPFIYSSLGQSLYLRFTHLVPEKPALVLRVSHFMVISVNKFSPVSQQAFVFEKAS